MRQARLALLLAATAALLVVSAWAANAVAAPQYWDTDASVSGNNATTGAGLGGVGNWSTAVANWWDGGAPGTLAGWTEGNEAFFLGTAGVVTLSGPRTANSLTFGTTGYTVIASTLTVTGGAALNVQAGTGTISSVLAGTAGYNKSGPGTLVLTATNTNTGPVNITGGVLEILSSAQIGSSAAGAGAVTVNGGTLRNSSTSTAGTWLTGNRGIVVGSAGGALDVPVPTAILIYTSGSITGPGNTLTKSGAGTLRVTTPTAITFSKLIISGGLYQAGADNIFGAVPTSFTPDAITLNGGGVSPNVGFNFHANRGITIGAAGGAFNAASAGTFLSVVSGPGALSKSGSGALTLAGDNTFEGGLNVFGGTVHLNHDHAAGSGVITVQPAIATTIRNSVPSSTIANNIVLNTGVSPTLDFFATTGQTLNLAGQISGAANWSRGNGGGTGTVVLSNSGNNFTGGLTVAQGNLAITANNALGATAGATTVNSGATLVMRGGFDYTAAESLVIAGNGVGSEGAIQSVADNNRFTGAITLLANSTVGVAAGELDLPGPITGAFQFRKAGLGTLILGNASNSFTSTAVNAGVLIVNADGNLGAAPTSTSLSNIQLAGGNLRAASSFALHPNRGINIIGATSAIDVPAGVAFTVPGAINGGEALIKTGGGSLVLGGTSAHTGGTNVNGGTVSLSLGAGLPGNVVIAPGATLHGSGSVGGNVTVGGTVAPGHGPGTLATAGSHTWPGGGAYEFEIDDATGKAGANWDQMTMSAVTVSATSSNRFVIRVVALPGAGGPGLDNFNPDEPFSWAIAVASSGTVTGFDLTKFEIDVTQFEQNNQNKGGFYVSHSFKGDLMLNYVPEPGAVALLTVGVFTLLRRRRRP